MKRDRIFERIWEQLQEKVEWTKLFRFVAEHDVDTDCIEDEVEIFDEENDGNLRKVLNGNIAVMRVIQSFLRHQRIMNKSFATGFPLFYWKWYRTATEQDVKGNRYLSSFMDLGGHSV